MKKIIKKSLAILAIIFSILFPNFSPARAISLDSPTPTGAMNQIMGDLGINKNELRNSIQTMNVARLKRQPPQVSLQFNPTDPVAGQKVTAMATPVYFMNDPKNLYFTWYLQVDGCSEDSHPNDYKRKKCDLDDDGDVDVNDYKIRAARIIASNGFDWDIDGDGKPDRDIYSSDSDNDGYEATWGGADQQGKPKHCFVYDTKSGDEYEVDCDHHLFAPDASMDENGRISVTRQGDDEFHGTQTVGEDSNGFGLSRERFWRTNPNDSDTANTGNSDEANVTGLGITNFSWTYTPGDKVGVVVEGVSNEPTQSYDSSYKTMWAMPNNDCLSNEKTSTDYPKTYPSSTTNTENPDGTTTSTTTTKKEFIVNGTQVEKTATIRTKITTVTVVTGTSPADGSVTIVSGPTTTATVTCPNDGSTTAQDEDGNTWNCSGTDLVTTIDVTVDKFKRASDLNKCLDDNLVEPQDGSGGAGKLDISLSYSPNYPMNDSSGEDSDLLMINSSISNIENTDFINYTWQVYSSDEPNPDSWGHQIPKSDLPDSTQTSGIGLRTFGFRLKFTDPAPKYLRVKLIAKENDAQGQTREGNADVVIPVSSSKDKIRVFNTDVNSNLMVSMNDAEICREGMDKAICPVIKNQIVGMKVNSASLTDFSWSVNGEALGYTQCFFEGCDPAKQSNIAFFPVLKDPGYDYTVTLSATDTETGNKVALTKVFEVSEPKVHIVSDDKQTCQPVLLGNYVDVDGKKWPDYSESNFVAASGKAIKLKASYTGFTPDDNNYVWYIDGAVITKKNALALGYAIDSNGNLILPGKPIGGSYDIGINALYSPNNQTKKALYTYWNVPYTGFYEKTVSDNINVRFVSTLSLNSQISQKNTPQKIMASIYSSFPSYLAFLFRIALSGLLLIFSSRFILSFFPHLKQGKNEI